MKSAAVLVVLAMVTPAEVGLAGMLGVRTGVIAGFAYSDICMAPRLALAAHPSGLLRALPPPARAGA